MLIYYESEKVLKKYFFLFVISLIIYFAHATYTLQGIYGDGNGYYSYANTLYFQRNLDFKPVYNYLSNFKGPKFTFSRIFWDQKTNPYLIGTAISWLPSFAFISFINKLLSLHIGRFDLAYELGAGISGILFMISGLYFLEKYLSNFFKASVAWWVVIGLFFASNIFYYTALEPGLSHQPSFLIISFLLFWTYKFKKTPQKIFALGLLCGFLATIRIADTVLLIPVLSQAKIKFKEIPFLGFGALLAFVPQLTIQNFIYGSAFTHPYLTGESGTWQFSLTHLAEYLVSPRRGLFLWTPVFLIGFYGLIKSRSWIYVLTLAVLWTVTSSWSAYLSAGFGQRLSFAAIPILAYGLAFIYQNLNVKKILLISVVLTIWNMLLIKNVYLHKDLFIQSSNFNFSQFSDFMFRLN